MVLELRIDVMAWRGKCVYGDVYDFCLRVCMAAMDLVVGVHDGFSRGCIYE